MFLALRSNKLISLTNYSLKSASKFILYLCYSTWYTIKPFPSFLRISTAFVFFLHYLALLPHFALLTDPDLHDSSCQVMVSLNSRSFYKLLKCIFISIASQAICSYVTLELFSTTSSLLFWVDFMDSLPLLG